MDARQLLKLAEEAEAQAQRLATEKVEIIGLYDRRISLAMTQAEELRAMAATAEALHVGGVKSRVKTNMHADHKLAISEGRATRDKKFKQASRKADLTQAALAKAVGMKESLLSMCRSGERAMFLSRAKKVQELTGWPADKAHWPGGIIEDA